MFGELWNNKSTNVIIKELRSYSHSKRDLEWVWSGSENVIQNMPIRLNKWIESEGNLIDY